MKKNVASQSVSAQLTTAANGTDFTGSVTVSVTGDNGTRATGSVGSGACTHEGGGLHSYAPAQAETNYDYVVFQFAGTGAVTSAIHIYTSFPQTGDNFARLGAPAGASVSADIVAVKADTAAILVDTGTTLDARIPAALVSGRMDSSTGAMAANVLTATAINADAITSAKVAADVSSEIADQVWDEVLSGHLTAGTTGFALNAAGSAGDPWGTALPGAYGAGTAGSRIGRIPDVAAGAAGGIFIAGTNAATTITTSLTTTFTGGLTGSVASVTGAVGSVTGAVGSVTGAVGSVTGAVGSVTGLTASNLDATVSSRLSTAGYTAPPSAATISAAVWAEVLDGTRTAIQLARGWTAALLGKASGLATTNALYRNIGDTKNVVNATVDADGNRSAVTLDLT